MVLSGSPASRKGLSAIAALEHVERLLCRSRSVLGTGTPWQCPPVNQLKDDRGCWRSNWKQTSWEEGAKATAWEFWVNSPLI